MTNWLALETSSRLTSVAVRGPHGVLFQESVFAERKATAPIFSLTQAALQALRQAELPLQGIVVGTGPGSYNGLRAGLALAAGLSLASGAPVAGWSSLLGLPPGRWVVAGDARGGQWFLAVVEEGVFLEEPALWPADPAKEVAHRKAKDLQAQCAWVGDTPPDAFWLLVWPTAARLLDVAHTWWLEQGSPPVADLPWPPAQPLYLKEPCITVGKAGAGPAPPANPAK